MKDGKASASSNDLRERAQFIKDRIEMEIKALRKEEQKRHNDPAYETWRDRPVGEVKE